MVADIQDSVEARTCRRCSVNLPIGCYPVSNPRNGYRRTECRDCYNAEMRQNRKPLSGARRMLFAEYKREYDIRNRSRIAEYGRKKYLTKKGKPEFKERNRLYMAARLANDPVYHLKHNLRIRVRKTIRRNSEGGRTITLLGAPVAFVLRELNGGAPIPAGVHVDHYVPINHFDLRDEGQQLVCFNWRNLRLLEGVLNLRKSDSLPCDYREREQEIREALSLDAASL